MTTATTQKTVAKAAPPQIGVKAIEGATAEIIFADGGVETIIQKIADEIRPAKIDLTTKPGRDAVASAAYKVTRAATILDDIGKESIADMKKRAAAVDAKRRVLREGLSTLRDEIRAPLTKFEDDEKNRVQAHEDALGSLPAMLAFAGERSPEEIEAQLQELGVIAQRDWQEYEARAVATIDHVREGLRKELAVAKQREAERAELERLREQQAIRDRKDHEARIAAEAAADARREAEERAAADRQRIEQEKADAIERAAQADRERIAAAEAAERAAVEAAEQAERDRQAAVAAERQRQADEQAREEAETRRRENNKRHAAKINNEVLAALVEAGVAEEIGKTIIVAIARGKIPHTKISY